MDENNLGPDRNTIPKIYAGANNGKVMSNKKPKEILDEDLKKATQKKDAGVAKAEKTKTAKDDLKVGINYRLDQGKALLKFGANTIFQKGKDKVYGTIDLLKKKID
mgnify:CR=1 FL=1|jgi:hypothetical protein